MDGQSCISRQTEPVSSAVESVNKQTTEAIESVANKLAIIGDELSQSYEKVSCSGVTLARTKSCVKLESCLNIVLLMLKASVGKLNKHPERKLSGNARNIEVSLEHCAFGINGFNLKFKRTGLSNLETHGRMPYGRQAKNDHPK